MPGLSVSKLRCLLPQPQKLSLGNRVWNAPTARAHRLQTENRRVGAFEGLIAGKAGEGDRIGISEWSEKRSEDARANRGEEFSIDVDAGAYR